MNASQPPMAPSWRRTGHQLIEAERRFQIGRGRSGGSSRGSNGGGRRSLALARCQRGARLVELPTQRLILSSRSSELRAGLGGGSGRSARRIVLHATRVQSTSFLAKGDLGAEEKGGQRSRPLKPASLHAAISVRSALISDSLVPR